MKTMSFKDANNEIIEIAFAKLTQICGSNSNLKNYIMNYIPGYFSKKKYSNEELEMYNSYLPTILINDELLGRTYFETYYICEQSDLNLYLSTTKDTPLFSYLLNLFENIDIAKSLAIISDEILIIEENVTNSIDKTFQNNIVINSLDIEKDFILKNLLDVKVKKNNLTSKYMTSYDKLLILLKLIENKIKLTNPKTLFCINNLENFVDRDNINHFEKYITKLIADYDIYFIISSNKKNYIIGDANDVETINIISDINLSLPDIFTLTNTINRHYPINYLWSEKEVYTMLKNICQNLFCNNYEYKSDKESVFIKLLNSFYEINCKKGNIQNLTQEEQNYLKN